MGRSYRTIKTRTDEHLNEIARKLKNTSGGNHYKSTFAEHVLTSNHVVDPDAPAIDILHSCSKDQITNYLEIMEILLAKHSSPIMLLNDNIDFNNFIISNLINKNIF